MATLLATVGSILVAAPFHAVAATCTPRQFKPCTVEQFMEQARDLREQIGMDAEEHRIRPLYADDHVVARFESPALARAAAAARASRVLASIDRKGTTLRLAVPKGKSASSFVAELRKDPAIVYAERDVARKSFAQFTEWGVSEMNAGVAHTNGFTGSGVTVAVVDTGVDYNHQDLATNMWTNPGEVAGNKLDDDGNGYVDDVRGYDFAGNLFFSTQPDSDPMDTAGHGTHVAGIVAAQDNGLGVLGVAPDATIMPVKVLDNIGAGWDSTIAEGIRYAADNGADIINMSLGGYGASGAMADAVAYAANLGVTIVAAAGNAWFYDFPAFPAGYPQVISVSAARRGDHDKTWWSDWGHADFIAPGLEIRSSTPDNTYSTFSGTSMASPHVAGALALIKEAHPSFLPDQLQQALASTATDVAFDGTDEVTGAGFPDAGAATGVLGDQVELNRHPYYIYADGSSASTVTLRILDTAGAPVSGVAGVWATDKGTLSGAAFVTDGDGEATVELTADDEWGSATVTADPVGYDAASVRVIVEDDRARIDDITVAKVVEEVPTDEPEPVPSSSSGPLPGGSQSPALQPGDRVRVNAYVGKHNFAFEDVRAAFSWEVSDPNGDPVPALSGAFEPVTLPGFGSQTVLPSATVTIPEDALPGTYTIDASVTTIKPDGDEEHTFSETFTIGVDETEILIVRSGFSFDAESFNFFWPHQYDSVVRQRIEDLGRSYTFWDTFDLGLPTTDELMRHSTVIWLGAWDEELPMSTLKPYLESGGNLLVSGETFGSLARLTGSPDYQPFMHSIGLLTTYFPDDNMQIYPSSVTGSSGGLFDGVTFDINAYDLNHRGQATSIFDEEHVVSGGATALFEYGDGVYSPAVAGASADTGVYRVVNLGFGLEAIDDQDQLSDVLDSILSSFAPSPSISGVFPTTVTNSGQSVFEISGAGFQPTGVSRVYFGATEIPGIDVVARDLVVGAVPAGFPVGTYTVKVVNPDGSFATKTSAVKVVYPAPIISAVVPNYASNHKARTFTVTGAYFRPGIKVRLAGVLLPTTFVSPNKVTATMPVGFTPLGAQQVRVTNTDGKTHARNGAMLVRYGFTFNFGPGAGGSPVTHLQRRLKFYGFWPASQATTGFYGASTQTAVLKYQKSRKLAQTGVVDAATRAKLNAEPGKEVV